MIHQKLYEDFVNVHRPQLISSGIPQHFWESLYRKVSKQIFDAGKVFSLLRIDYEDENRSEYDPICQLQVSTEEGIKVNDPQQIYLIDHAWTFRVDSAREQLRQLHCLRNRMANLVGIKSDRDPEIVVEDIFKEMWKYCNHYSVANAESAEARVPVWYIMDEVGSAIQHSNSPNFRMVPFFYTVEQITYSLIFPITNLEYEEVVTRDFVEGEFTKEERAAYLIPWRYISFVDRNHLHEEPGPDYFLSRDIRETVPVTSTIRGFSRNRTSVKVFSEYSCVNQYLTDSKFKIVNDENEADILWYTRHYKNFEELYKTPIKFVNQFPFEYILTIKDLLCVISRRKAPVGALAPAWLPVTYNLKTELVKFVSYFQKREEEELGNHWIIKPFNLARGLDTHITNNLNCIIRLATTGPKIAQKYIENPVLFHDHDTDGKVKFDIRYVLLLVRIKPLIVYVYKNFFLRFANKPFKLEDFDDYSRHFTVMNYTEKSKIKHMLCSDFKIKWEMQYPNYAWENMEGKIFGMFREVFECSVMKEPPCGIPNSPHSRALYAADLMLEWDDSEMQPKLLEINWMPDCKRVCEYYNNFYNDIFNIFFFGDDSDVFQRL